MSRIKNKAQLGRLEEVIDQLTQKISYFTTRHTFEEAAQAAETLQRMTDAYSTLKELIIHEEYVNNMKDEPAVDTEFMLPGEGPLKSSN